MKKEGFYIGLIIIIIFISFLCSNIYINNKKISISSDYKLKLTGEDLTNMYTTYVYEVKLNKRVMFKYINTIKNITTDKEKQEEKIFSKGKEESIEKIYEISKEFKSYENVKFKDDKKNYTIEESLFKLK